MKRNLPLLIMMMALFAAMFVPCDVFAQAGPGTGSTAALADPDLKGTAKQLASQSSNIAKLMAVLSYVGGVYLSVTGVYSLKAWIVDAERNPLGKALGTLLAAALLILLPYTTRLFRNSGAIFLDKSGVDSAAGSFIEKGMVDPGGNNNSSDFHKAQYNASLNALNVPKFVSVLAYVGGTFFCAIGLVRLKDWMQDSAKNPITPALFSLVAGALMIAFPHVLYITTSTFFAYGTGSAASVQVNVKTKMGNLSPFGTL